MHERFEQEIVAVRGVRIRGRAPLPDFDELWLSVGALILGAAVGLATRLI
jgi:hypothetical protein